MPCDPSMDPYSKRKKSELLTKQQHESNENEKNCYLCAEEC